MLSKTVKHTPPGLMLLAIVLPVVLIIAPAIVAYRAQTDVNKSFRWVTHTLEVEGAIQSVVNSLVDAETGQRGFLLTRLEPYLEPYDAGVARVGQQLSDLRIETADNASQQDRLKQLQPLIRERLDLLAQTIAAEKRGDHEAAIASVNSGRGKYVMDEIRGVLRVMADEEHRLMWIRQQQLSAQGRQSAIVLWVLVALTAASVGGGLYLLYRMSRMRPLVTMCAVSRTIEYQGEWLSFEEYLERRFGLRTSHGLSPEALEEAKAGAFAESPSEQ